MVRNRRGFLAFFLNFATRTPVLFSVLLQKSVFLENGSLFLQQSTIFVTICTKVVAKRIFLMGAPTDRFASLQIASSQIKLSKSSCPAINTRHAARTTGATRKTHRLQSLITCQEFIEIGARGRSQSKCFRAWHLPSRARLDCGLAFGENNLAAWSTRSPSGTGSRDLQKWPAAEPDLRR